MQTLYIVLIIVGVIIALMAVIVLLETLTKQGKTQTSDETIVQTATEENYLWYRSLFSM